MSYTPTKATQQSLYGYAMSYTPAKVQSVKKAASSNNDKLPAE